MLDCDEQAASGTADGIHMATTASPVPTSHALNSIDARVSTSPKTKTAAPASVTVTPAGTTLAPAGLGIAATKCRQ